MTDEWRWSPDETRRVGYRVVDLIAEYLSGLEEKPVFRPFPDALAEAYRLAPAPEKGQPIDEILDSLEKEVLAYPFGNGHARFAAWVNSAPDLLAVFADAIAAAMNPSVAGGNHAPVHVEHQVINWFKDILALPRSAAGLLTSGGSMASLTALTVARHRSARKPVREHGLQDQDQTLTVYVAESGHSCIRKAVELLGIGNRNLRRVPIDERFEMDVAALESMLEKDIAEGFRPMAVVASVGTVDTGAVDPLARIAEVCRKHEVWLHVDGAYGAPALLAESHAALRSEIPNVDSIALDPHKWMYVPVEAGLVLVKDAEAMRAAFSFVPPYLKVSEGARQVGGPTWFSEYGFQQTRGFRALKVWVALKYHGTEGYRAAIERDITLAKELADAIRKSPDFELLQPQSMSIVCFRYRPEGASDATLDGLNEALLTKLQLDGRYFLSGTSFVDRFWLRACLVNPRRSSEDLAELLDTLRELARKD